MSLGLVWITQERAQQPGSVIRDSPLRSPMPVIVVGPPMWVYLLAGTLGALLGVLAVIRAHHRRRRAEYNLS